MQNIPRGKYDEQAAVRLIGQGKLPKMNLLAADPDPRIFAWVMIGKPLRGSKSYQANSHLG